MNTDSMQPSDPECASYVSRIPQLRHDTLESTVAIALRAHLEHCPFCQEQLAAYDQLDAKLRSYARRFASTAPTPDAMIHAALTTPTAARALDTAHMRHTAASLRKSFWLPFSPGRQPVPQEIRSMRFTRQHPVAATIAALLVIVMAAAIFTMIAHLRPGTATSGTLPTPTPRSLATHAITARQAWGSNAAMRTFDTQIDATHVFQASAISPDGKLLLGFLTPTQGTAGAQEQAGYYDIATHHFNAIGISQPWPEPPDCCQIDGHYLLAAINTMPGATCGLCHRAYYSYDMDTRQLWQIAKGSDYGEVQNTFLDHGHVLLDAGRGLFEANLATHTIAHVPYPPGSTQILSFALPYLIYSAPPFNSATPLTRAYNLTTQADVALPQLDNLQVKGGIRAAVTGDTLFITQTTNIDTTHATTILYEDDAFLTSSASLHTLAAYNEQLGVVAANTRLVAFYGALVWDRTEQRFVALATDGQQARDVNVVLSGHFLAVLQTNNSSGAAMPQHVTIYDTDTLPTALGP